MARKRINTRLQLSPEVQREVNTRASVAHRSARGELEWALALLYGASGGALYAQLRALEAQELHTEAPGRATAPPSAPLAPASSTRVNLGSATAPPSVTPKLPAKTTPEYPPSGASVGKRPRGAIEFDPKALPGEKYFEWQFLSSDGSDFCLSCTQPFENCKCPLADQFLPEKRVSLLTKKVP